MEVNHEQSNSPAQGSGAHLQHPHESHNERNETKRVYQHTKWTDEMIKLLITFVSCIWPDIWSNGTFPEIDDWTVISNAMAKRGHRVSPYCCKNKFNNLNKKFKRLNEILGRVIAYCVVLVQDPSIVERLDLTFDARMEVKTLLSSTQLFYQEMCSLEFQQAARLEAETAQKKHIEETRPVVYQRTKWTDELVKLLITTISCIWPDIWSDEAFTKEDEWKVISNVMVRRGHRVSPNRCKYKFNDLKQKFKRLNEMLGRITAYSAVQDPSVVEMLDLTCDAREQVTTLLSSTQLIYQEMCCLEFQDAARLACKCKNRYEPEHSELKNSAMGKIVGEGASDMNHTSLNYISNSDAKVVQNSNNDKAEKVQKRYEPEHVIHDIGAKKKKIVGEDGASNMNSRSWITPTNKGSEDFGNNDDRQC